jgi:hypothetical protein
VSAVLTDDAPDELQIPNPPPPIRTLGVTRLSRSKNVVGRVSTPIGAWWVEGEVHEFVTKLISNKRTQGEDYPGLWLLIFERTGILSADSSQLVSTNTAPTCPRTGGASSTSRGRKSRRCSLRTGRPRSRLDACDDHPWSSYSVAPTQIVRVARLRASAPSTP